MLLLPGQGYLEGGVSLDLGGLERELGRLDLMPLALEDHLLRLFGQVLGSVHLLQLPEFLLGVLQVVARTLELKVGQLLGLRPIDLEELGQVLVRLRLVALGRGNLLTAKSNWLRAIGYYQSAAFPFDLTDDKHRAAVASMQECARNYLRHRAPAGEVVEIAWPDGYPLEAYFLPAPGAEARAPATVDVARSAKPGYPSAGRAKSPARRPAATKNRRCGGRWAAAKWCG